MRACANLFLILFVADGGFSLVDELVSLFTPLMPFTALRNTLAVTVIFTSIPIYFSLGIDRRLPKRVFLPPVIFVFWTIISTWLFPPLAEIRIYGLLMAVVQVALGMLPLFVFRDGGERRLTIPPVVFNAPFFSVRNFLTFFVVNLLVVPLALLLVVLTAANATMSESTAGFTRITPTGVTMSERTYVRGNRTIRLVGMIHIGNRKYYDEVAAPVSPGRSIVLAEGVTDDRKLIHNRIDYGKVAGVLGLVPQERLPFKGRLIDGEEFESLQPLPDAAGKLPVPASIDILRCDVDVSEFRQPTINLLNALGENMRAHDSFVKELLAFNAWAKKNVTPETQKNFMDDILHRRNQVVIRHLDKALERYDSVIIPWGALHLPEIEAEIMKRGFQIKTRRELVSISFWRLLRQ